MLIFIMFEERDYSQEGMTQEKKAYYAKMNQSKNKRVADMSEMYILGLLKGMGYDIRKSTADEDQHSHADLVLADGRTIDVKVKQKFILELQNRWGHPGWLFTGADIIIQCFKGSEYWGDDIYVYDRREMVKYYYTHKGIFAPRYCEKTTDGSILWALGKKRLATMPFVKKINLK